MSNSREYRDVNVTTEDKVNAMRGYKATLKNPRVSHEAKQHACDVLNNEIGWDDPRHELYRIRATNKDPTQVGAGLKAAQKNPRVKDRGRKSSAEKLEQLDRQTPEE